jgi:ubiquinone/menaquinone biosynthesis C-methylase UbiE
VNWIHRRLCSSGLWRRALAHKLLPWALDGTELGDHLLEVGAGPGLTTDWLRQRVPSLTALEIDPRLAASLAARLVATNVRVVEGDATKMPFEDGSFSSVVALTMLHHVPSAELQDRLLAEVHRVLRPGGVFRGTDSRWSRLFQLIHIGDTMVIVDPSTFQTRLETVGFGEVSVESVARAFRFRARKKMEAR